MPGVTERDPLQPAGLSCRGGGEREPSKQTQVRKLDFSIARFAMLQRIFMAPGRDVKRQDSRARLGWFCSGKCP